MKELRDYTAEVIRRASIKKMRRRAKLVRTLGASCLAPVCLAALLGILSRLRASNQIADEAMPLLSPAVSENSDEEIPVRTEDHPAVDGEIKSEPACRYLSAEVKLQDGRTLTISSPIEAEAIAAAIREAVSNSEAADNNFEDIPEDHGSRIHVRLTTASGETEEYLIIGNLLCCLDTGKAYQMPDGVLSKLTSDLGI